MTDKQPEALRLADALRKLHEAKKYHPTGPGGQMCGSEQYRLITSGLAFEDLQNAAAELRRLHEVNAELVGVLQDIRDNYDCDEDAHKYGSRCRSCVAHAAIAKATGEQQ
jgi:hypothetical protein